MIRIEVLIQNRWLVTMRNTVILTASTSVFTKKLALEVDSKLVAAMPTAWRAAFARGATGDEQENAENAVRWKNPQVGSWFLYLFL